MTVLVLLAANKDHFDSTGAGDWRIGRPATGTSALGRVQRPAEAAVGRAAAVTSSALPWGTGLIPDRRTSRRKGPVGSATCLGGTGSAVVYDRSRILQFSSLDQRQETKDMSAAAPEKVAEAFAGAFHRHPDSHVVGPACPPTPHGKTTPADGTGDFSERIERPFVSYLDVEHSDPAVAGPSEEANDAHGTLLGARHEVISAATGLMERRRFVGERGDSAIWHPSSGHGGWRRG